jgi:hypothetical protein
VTPQYIYAVPICANCRFFDWKPKARDDTGTCSKHQRDVDGKDEACRHFDFDPPCGRKREGHCVICGRPATGDLCPACQNDPGARATYDTAMWEADDARV